MQDRFKFRVVYYNDVEKKYFIFEPDLISADGTARAYAYGESGADEYYDTVTLNQCTGLKDKNGRLIYEGDIVKIEYFDFEIKYRIGIIKWEDDGFCITYHKPKDTKVSGCSLVDIVNGDKQEVIGNRYENPELLDVKMNREQKERLIEKIEYDIKSDMILQEEKKKIKRSECPYGGIDCAWCCEDCE